MGDKSHFLSFSSAWSMKKKETNKVKNINSMALEVALKGIVLVMAMQTLTSSIKTPMI